MGRKVVNNHSTLPFHVTARTHNRAPFVIPIEAVWQIFEMQLYFISYAFDVKVEAFVLMGNHFHLIISAPNGNLSLAMAWLMRETSREINRRSGRVNQQWGARFYRSELRSDIYYSHAYKYLYRNPAQISLCENVLDYPYSTLRGLVGVDILRIPTIDQRMFAMGEESCLSWLNTSVDPKHWKIVGNALRKSVFKLAEKSGGKKSELETDML